MDLVVHAYRLSDGFPRDEDFALKTQLRRSAVSVPSNIAEGHGRTGVPEYLHHLSIAHGSLMELETHLLIAVQLEYLDRPQLEGILSEAEEISRMIKGLMRRLRASASSSNAG